MPKDGNDFIDYVKAQIKAVESGAELPLSSGNWRDEAPLTRVPSFKELRFVSSGLIYRPENSTFTPNTSITIGGPICKNPISLPMPFWGGAISFGAAGIEFLTAVAMASKRAGIPFNTGEGGLHPLLKKECDKIIIQYASGRFGVSADYINSGSIIEIKLGQGAKPSKGGKLPAWKVSEEIARSRYVKPWQELNSPAPHDDISSVEDLRAMVRRLRQATGNEVVIGIKLGPNDIAADVTASAVALEGDGYIAIDGAGAGTGAAFTLSMENFGVTTLALIAEAREALDNMDRQYHYIKLGVAGGLGRGAADTVKALFLGADFVYMSKAMMIAGSCIDCGMCHTNKCPAGICTQNEKLRKRYDINENAASITSFWSAQRRMLEEVLTAYGLESLYTKTGERNVSPDNLIAVTERTSELTGAPHGTPNGPNYRKIKREQMSHMGFIRESSFQYNTIMRLLKEKL